MAEALHSRDLHTTDLQEQVADAQKQLRASRLASELGLRERKELFGSCLDLTFSGAAEAVARFVETCDAEDIYISSVTSRDEDEYAALAERIVGITDLSEPSI